MTSGQTASQSAGTAGADRSGLTIDSVMRGIMEQESGGNYQAQSATETASGAYQYIDGTWDHYQGYAHAKDAPAAVQDQKMREDLQREYQRLGDWERVIAAHFVGEDGQVGSKSQWDRVPGPAENNNPSIRSYVDSVLGHIQDSGTSASTDSTQSGVTGTGAFAIDAGTTVSTPESAGQHDPLQVAFQQAMGMNIFAPGTQPEVAPGYALIHSQTSTVTTTGAAGAAPAQAADEASSHSAAGASSPAQATGTHSVQHMLDAALAQTGDEYVFGAPDDLNNPNPTTFDCSSLTEWAAHEAGVDLPRTSYEQYLLLKDKDLLISVDQAAKTPGALIFHFSSQPVEGGGRPTEAHVAMVTNTEGKDIEAYDENHGVNTFDMGNRFNYAALLPGMDYGAAVTSPHGDTNVTPAGGGADPAVAAGDQAHHDPSNLTVDAVMHGIMMQESGGNYTAQNSTSSASGAYQYIDRTWNNYGGYAHAKDAPAAVQDERMRADVTAARDHFNGDWERVIAAHFAGEDGQDGPKTNWSTHPGNDYNQNPSIWDYVNSVLDHIDETDPAALGPAPASSSAQASTAAGGYAIDSGAAVSTPESAGQHDALALAFEHAIGVDAFAPTSTPVTAAGYEMVHSETSTIAIDPGQGGATSGLESSLGTDLLGSHSSLSEVDAASLDGTDPGHHSAGVADLLSH